MAYHCGNLFLPYFSFTLWYEQFLFIYLFFSFLCIPLSLLLWCYQAAQITHVLAERMGELTEEAEQERVLKDVADAIARDKGRAVEKKAQSSKEARLLAKKRSAEIETKLEETELKLAQVESLNLAHAEEVAKLKAALEACENKWYKEGFVDAENSVKPIVHQAQVQGFEEGWLAAL